MGDALQQELHQLLSQSLSAAYEERKAAEENLAASESAPGFIQGLMKETIAPVSPPYNVVSPTHMAAAVYLKNYVRIRWHKPDEQGGLSLESRDIIKRDLLAIYVSPQTHRSIRMQLAGCLAIIAEVEFPLEWSDLLLVMTQHIVSPDLSIQIAVLEVLHTILGRYRSVSSSTEVLLELKCILETLPKPFLECFMSAQQSFHSASSIEAMTQLLHILCLCCKIFYSLNVVDLPEWFEDHLKEWLDSFTNILRWQPDYLLKAAEAHPSATEAIDFLNRSKSQICDNMTLYSDKYQEEFSPYVWQCIEAVWGLIKALDDSSSHDAIVCAAIHFLASAAQTQWELPADTPSINTGSTNQVNPFSNSDVLRELCTKLIVPSVHLRDYDITMMEENPQEFLYKDLEGGDQNLRRTAALELIKALAKLHDKQITLILVECISALSNQYSKALSDSASERLKEACTYLMIGVAVRGATRTKGVVLVNPQVDLLQFYGTHLASELLGDNLDEHVLCRCAAMKYIATFRNQFPPESLHNTLPLLVRHLSARNAIVHSNAAYSIERLFTLKTGVWDIKTVKPILFSALDPLLRIICTSKIIPDNEYAIKCLLRIFLFLDSEAAQVALPVMKQLLEVVKVKSNNPTNPIFNHYLFETVGVILKIASVHQFADVESSLVPIISTLVQQGMHDFTPYCFQILGLLLDFTASGSEWYVNLFNNLMDVRFWNVSHANVPGLVRLMTAYFRKSQLFYSTIAKNMEALLQRFQYCLYHRKLTTVGFELLNGVFRYLPYSLYSAFFQTLVVMLLVRIQELNKTPAFCRDVITSLSLFVCKQESQTILLDTLNRIENDLATKFFQLIVLPNVPDISDWRSKKVVVLALAKLCTTPAFLNSPALLRDSLWRISQLLEGEGDNSSNSRRRAPAVEAEEDMKAYEINEMAREHFDVVYAQLGSAQVASKDMLENVTDVQSGIRVYLASVPAILEIVAGDKLGHRPIVKLLQEPLDLHH